MPESSPKAGSTPQRPPDIANVTVDLEQITPELAAEWLKGSPALNRGIGKRVVYRYATALIEKRWWFTGESVIFGLDGRLLDGWHRLTAIVESGVAAWFIVVRGVSNRAFHYIDNGRGRSFRDTIAVL
jgi:hypothetical protein